MSRFNREMLTESIREVVDDRIPGHYASEHGGLLNVDLLVYEIVATVLAEERRQKDPVS